MFELRTDAPTDAVRAEYMRELLNSGYSPGEAALIFDLAWQANAEAQTTLMRVANRVPQALQIATGGLAAHMLGLAMRSLITHCADVANRKVQEHTVDDIIRKLFGEGGI